VDAAAAAGRARREAFLVGPDILGDDQIARTFSIHNLWEPQGVKGTALQEPVPERSAMPCILHRLTKARLIPHCDLTYIVQSHVAM
jgi:hypothetical protein